MPAPFLLLQQRFSFRPVNSKQPMHQLELLFSPLNNRQYRYF